MKARTKAGRKRKSGVKRQPNGQPARSAVETRESAKATVIEARMRLYGASKTDCEREEMGHVLGRLFLNPTNGISPAMYQAGLRMAREYSRYYGLCGVQFPSPRAQDLFRVGGEPSDVDPDRARQARNDAQAIELVLAIGDESGCPVRTVTKRVCIEDRDEGMYQRHMIGYLRKGLKLLVEHYGIEAGRVSRAA